MSSSGDYGHMFSFDSLSKPLFKQCWGNSLGDEESLVDTNPSMVVYLVHPWRKSKHCMKYGRPPLVLITSRLPLTTTQLYGFSGKQCNSFPFGKALYMRALWNTKIMCIPQSNFTLDPLISHVTSCMLFESNQQLQHSKVKVQISIHLKRNSRNGSFRF